MLLRIVAAFALLFAAPALAATGTAADALAGSWELKAGGVAIMRFELRRASGGWFGTWERPTEWNTDGSGFSKLIGPAVTVRGTGSADANGDIAVTFANPEPGAKQDLLRFRLVDPTHAKGIFGNGFSLPLSRTVDHGPIGPWPAGRPYAIDVVRPTNAEMTAIYDTDQAARKMPRADWKVIEAEDGKRRTRTQELLDAGALQSGEDFEHAAFVFQHGVAAEDFLKAHLLAMVAVARGQPGAIWIASASLDRYLVNTGHPQVLGTQFALPRDGVVTQEPYDRTLISDQLREALHVPALADQEIRRQRMEQERAAAK